MSIVSHNRRAGIPSDLVALLKFSILKDFKTSSVVNSITKRTGPVTCDESSGGITIVDGEKTDAK